MHDRDIRGDLLRSGGADARIRNPDGSWRPKRGRLAHGPVWWNEIGRRSSGSGASRRIRVHAFFTLTPLWHQFTRYGDIYLRIDVPPARGSVRLPDARAASHQS